MSQHLLFILLLTSGLQAASLSLNDVDQYVEVVEKYVKESGENAIACDDDPCDDDPLSEMSDETAIDPGTQLLSGLSAYAEHVAEDITDGGYRIATAPLNNIPSLEDVAMDFGMGRNPLSRYKEDVTDDVKAGRKEMVGAVGHSIPKLTFPRHEEDHELPLLTALSTLRAGLGLGR